MNGHIVFGLFGLYVASISLYMVLTGRQESMLEQLRSFWGRPVGHSLYFVANVALPLLICVFCLGWGVRHYDATVAFRPTPVQLHLDLDSCRDLRLLLQKKQDPVQTDIVYGA